MESAPDVAIRDFLSWSARNMAAAHGSAVLAIDNETLIVAVESRPSIWQSKLRDHRNRYKKAMLWNEVAAVVLPGGADAGKPTSLDRSTWHVFHCFRSKFSVVLFALAVNNVQKRWKYLRDRFRRVFNAKRRSFKSGSAADFDDHIYDDDDENNENIGNDDANWAFYNQLAFLKDEIAG